MQLDTSQKVEGTIPDGVIGIFSLTLWHRNEYQEYFRGVKAVGA
jgi:hypothetical protein